MNMESIEIECPECGCKQIFMKKKKFNKLSLAIGAIAALVPHPIVKLVGLTSVFLFNWRLGKIECTCPKCNFVWFPSELEDKKDE